jgi:hypothetical protein
VDEVTDQLDPRAGTIVIRIDDYLVDQPSRDLQRGGVTAGSKTRDKPVDLCRIGLAANAIEAARVGRWLDGYDGREVVTAALGYASPCLAGSVLPQPDPAFHGKIAASRDHSQPDWPVPVKAPANAPNIVLVLLDDVGFAAAGTFDGPAATPRLDQLAASGVCYNDFNTTAICSPTRASLLTGRNQHQVGFGNLQDVAAGFPGFNTIWHRNTASVAEVLRESRRMRKSAACWTASRRKAMTRTRSSCTWSAIMAAVPRVGWKARTSTWQPSAAARAISPPC